MTSPTFIANRALTKLGADNILTMTDNTKQGRLVNSLYDSVLSMCLRSHLWNFAKKRAALAASTETPAWGYLYTYPQPSDCLRLVEINGAYVPYSMYDYVQSDLRPWSIEGRNILTNLGAPLLIRYIRKEDDVSLFDATFLEAFASMLAYEMAEALTQSADKKKFAMADYDRAIGEAKRLSSIENPPQAFYDGSWTLSRNG